MAIDRTVFSSEFFSLIDYSNAKLKQLKLGKNLGEGVSKGRGGKQEFLDYRKYSPGDDFRLVDWNIFGRTGKLFIKEFLREEVPAITIIIDSSASMGIGSPEKIIQTKRLTGLLLNLIQFNGGSAHLIALQQQEHIKLQTKSGKIGFNEALEFLSRLNPLGFPSLTNSIKNILQQQNAAAIIFISDLWGNEETFRENTLTSPLRSYPHRP